MPLISFRLSNHLLEEIDRLVAEGQFSSRAEAIRSAIREKLIEEAIAERCANELANKKGSKNIIVPKSD